MGQGQEQLNKWADRGKLRQENKPHCGPHETGTPPPPLATTTSSSSSSFVDAISCVQECSVFTRQAIYLLAVSISN